MCNDEKGLSTPRLGVRGLIAAKKTQTEQLARPSQWTPGTRALSFDEFDQFTDQLALELLATCTPAHLAVVAAQHMIYADELKCELEENRAEPINAIELAGEIAANVATDVTLIALRAQRKHLAEKRADAVRKGKEDVIALARRIAAKEWGEDTERKIKIGEMAKKIYNALLETKHCKLVSSSDSVRRWIRPVAPEYAKKPGP